MIRRAVSLEDGFGHFVFDQGRIVWVGLGATGFDEAEALVEGDGCEVAAGDHELEGVCFAAPSPRFDCVDEEAAGVGATVFGRDPHGDEFGVLWGLFVEEGGGNAAVLVLMVGEVADGARGAEIGGALQPVGVGELGFAGIGAAEGAWSVAEGAEADLFVDRGQSWGDLVESCHGEGYRSVNDG